ncbi:hypothetical protein CAC42_2841 [Sphaceloma murrayae]|uniref:Uncharacterized protein n=1 Tax=Sphaceloma murrayae TaxID=2082308 RepID=A0A2K1R0Z8_9PEZI|nr:hypothetical protein CAC42_2841 [Sphaceloma murrayae]
MSDDEISSGAHTSSAATRPSRDEARGKSWTDIFALPRPLKELFSKFPLVTYPANELPSRSPRHEGKHALYVFSTPDAARQNDPSYNPTCLKWQTYMRLRDIDFTTVASTNHASPSGALPFLLPGPRASGNPVPKNDSISPIPSPRIRRWVDDQRPPPPAKDEPGLSQRQDLYMSLLDHRLRRAWLYQLYLHPQNAPLLHTLYVAPCTASSPVQTALAHQLRSAAEEELRKSSGGRRIPEEALMREGEEALDALEEMLGQDEWFFGAGEAGLFDAAVFAYTHLLLEEDELGWGWNPLGGGLKGRKALVKHRRRVWKRAYA